MGRRLEEKLENKIAKAMVQVVNTIAGLAIMNAFMFDILEGDSCGIIDHLNDKLISFEDSSNR